MDEFTSALNVYLDGLAPSSKLAYMKKMTSFIEFRENGTNDGPYAVTLEDVSVYIISLHEIGYKTSTLWSTLSMIAIKHPRLCQQCPSDLAHPI